MVELDYLVIGHVTRDLVDGGFAIGGTVSYSARTARALGCRAGIITSASSDLDLSHILDNIPVTHTPAAATTTFENVYTPGGRQQVLHATAETLTPKMMPPDWTIAPGGVVHLGPVAQECAPALADAFEGTFVGLTPQGWMRRWDQAGRVSRCPWEGASALLIKADAVVLSEEDVASDEALVRQYAAQTRLLVLTRGPSGCTVYTEGRSRSFPAPAVKETDATGCGDIFATAFFVWLQRSGDPWDAAHFANCIAARSVTRSGLEGTPTPNEVVECEQALNAERNAQNARIM